MTKISLDNLEGGLRQYMLKKSWSWVALFVLCLFYSLTSPKMALHTFEGSEWNACYYYFFFFFLKEFLQLVSRKQIRDLSIGYFKSDATMSVGIGSQTLVEDVCSEICQTMPRHIWIFLSDDDEDLSWQDLNMALRALTFFKSSLIGCFPRCKVLGFDADISFLHA